MSEMRTATAALRCISQRQRWADTAEKMVRSTVLKNIDEVWDRLSSLAGETFQTKTGKPFTFSISGEVLRVSRTEYNLSKGNFAKVIEITPFDGPGTINNLVRGPSYVWAILHDVRVRKDEW